LEGLVDLTSIDRKQNQLEILISGQFFELVKGVFLEERFEGHEKL
jgi:hypothetical protein